MLKKILLCVLLLSGGTLMAQKCADVKTGTFRMPGDGADSNESILTRTAQYQIEDVPALGLRIQLDLKWTSECTYELKNPKVLKGSMPEGIDTSLVLRVKITRVTSGKYTAVISTVGFDGEIVQDIFIVK